MRAAAVAVIVAELVLAPAARADLPANAKARYEAGLAHYTAGRYADAVGELEAAYAIAPDPVVLYALAQAERFADRCPAALAHYHAYIDSKPNQTAIDAANVGIALCEAKTPRPSEPALPWYKDPVGGAVVGGALALGVGVGYLFASSANADRADRAQTSAAFDDAIDRATSQRRIGVTFLILGTGLAGGGVGYYFWKHREHAHETVVGTTGTSLYVAGTF